MYYNEISAFTVSFPDDNRANRIYTWMKSKIILDTLKKS
jgi:hypothetical protein